MNKIISHEMNALPKSIEAQLKDLELRHARHQRMLEEHRECKHTRRERYMLGERSQTLLDFDSAKAGLQATADLGKQELGIC
jgi:hypothetical protein